METKYCLDCETKILGRADKKFCSDACRNNYNNRQNSDTTALMRNINNALRKNRRILQESITNEEGKASVPTKKLTSQGFSFDHFTHILNTKTGNTYYFCYEYGYRKLDGDYYLVVKREE
jgi:predicted nucleic acid-binding Zn ribbon protein